MAVSPRRYYAGRRRPAALGTRMERQRQPHRSACARACSSRSMATAFAEEALLVATRLALALGGELVLLHAVSPFEQVFMPEAILANFPEQEAARGAEARDYLDNWWRAVLPVAARPPSMCGLDVPTLAIEEAARDHSADLVIMATHGRTALGRLALGSVADAVLQYSRVPLLLVRPRVVRPAENG